MREIVKAAAAATDMGRIEARAKFFFDGDSKFSLQGVTYGPFRPASPDAPHFPAPEKAAIDFILMRGMGINAVRLYHPPPCWLADLVVAHGLRLLITVPWDPRGSFLDDRVHIERTLARVEETAREFANHPAIFGYIIDNEIPPDLVRWYGARRIERHLDSVVRRIKCCDSRALVTYANYPPTEYLLPAEVDFYSYNIYLHREKDLTAYLARLQNLARDKPLVLSEFGLDTIRHSPDEQARLLRAGVETACRGGLAGTIIFSWTDEWFTDDREVREWAFGLVTRERQPKPACLALEPLLKRADEPMYQRFPPRRDLPMASVVVCTYNGARTLRECLASLTRLDYPDYEIIVVDDGSKDTTQEIMKDFPTVRNVVQPHRGLSTARNAGIAAAVGEIVAFTDSDCVVDRDWLYFLATSLLDGDFAAAGGPNIPTPARNRIHAAVGSAPGAPSHVLMTDSIAEHVPGCNIAFHKWALESIGGFDPEFRTAGDDVDVCWRLMQRGWNIGFCPGAVVWHHRRFEIATYFRQQTGYGEAEALLRFKHLQYFDATGSALWRGRVYSQVRMDHLFSRTVIYHGAFATGMFQSIYPRRYSPWAGLVGSLEWLGVTLFIFFLAVPLEGLRLIPLLMSVLTLAAGAAYAVQARIDPAYDGPGARLLLFYLAVMQPWRRAWARYFTWLRGKRTPAAVIASPEDAPHLTVTWPVAGRLAFWSDEGVERTSLLESIQRLLEEEGWKYAPDNGWSDWDFHIFAGRWWNLRLQTVTEPYPRNRRLTRVRNVLHASTFSALVGGVMFTAALVTLLVLPAGANRFALPLELGAGVSVLAIAWCLHGLRLRHRLAQLVEVAATRCGLQTVSEAPTRPSGKA